jgi:hypothetical protein
MALSDGVVGRSCGGLEEVEPSRREGTLGPPAGAGDPVAPLAASCRFVSSGPASALFLVVSRCRDMTGGSAKRT